MCHVFGYQKSAKSIHLLGQVCPEKPPAVPDGNAIGAGGVCSDLTEHIWTRGAAECAWQGAGTQNVGAKKGKKRKGMGAEQQMKIPADPGLDRMGRGL